MSHHSKRLPGPVYPAHFMSISLLSTGRDMMNELEVFELVRIRVEEVSNSDENRFPKGSTGSWPLCQWKDWKSGSACGSVV